MQKETPLSAAVHGRIRNADDRERLLRILSTVEECLGPVPISQALAGKLRDSGNMGGRSTFSPQGLRSGEFSVLITIGGDGTILDAARMVGDSGIPILGINNGRLGFLASIPAHQTQEALQRMLADDYFVDSRTVLEVAFAGRSKVSPLFALNEVSVHKSSSSSMTVVHVYVDDAFLNTYWADGLVISTPTGSTGYSLSAGGPIVSPDASCFIISPIAPHNLNVRPLIIPDTHRIRIRMDASEPDCLASVDGSSTPMPPGATIELRKGAFSVGLIRFDREGYFNTLRSKLMWGLDSRN